MDKCLRTVLWRNDRFHMYEYCSLIEKEQELILAGTVVTVSEQKPMRIAYQVVCDSLGLTRSVTVDAVSGLREHHIQLAVDEQRAWYWNGRELPECRGFADVDLGFTPATNTLPIRRLKLSPGQSQSISVTWVRFPEFDVIPFPQRYTCLAVDRYRFESLIDDFQAELLVDDEGIVQQYGQFWESVAQDCGEVIQG